MVRETRRSWGFLPFKRYVFLNVVRQGGLEHATSTLLTRAGTTGDGSWVLEVRRERPPPSANTSPPSPRHLAGRDNESKVRGICVPDRDRTPHLLHSIGLRIARSADSGVAVGLRCR
jgi:hypothetical protein